MSFPTSKILSNPVARQAYYDELRARRRQRLESQSDDVAQRVREDVARWRVYRRMGKTLAKGGCL